MPVPHGNPKTRQVSITRERLSVRTTVIAVDPAPDAVADPRARTRMPSLGNQSSHRRPDTVRAVCRGWACLHSSDIEPCIIEQCQVNLPAHRGNIGLVEQQTGRPSNKSPAEAGQGIPEGTPQCLAYSPCSVSPNFRAPFPASPMPSRHPNSSETAPWPHPAWPRGLLASSDRSRPSTRTSADCEVRRVFRRCGRPPTRR
jgi:hypothetical protein